MVNGFCKNATPGSSAPWRTIASSVYPEMKSTRTEGRTRLKAYARDLGLAYQIADDLLDVEGDSEATGKAVNKDRDAGKATFVSLLGIDRARQQAHMLVDQAIGHLSSFGTEANVLRDVARYVIERDR